MGPKIHACDTNPIHDIQEQLFDAAESLADGGSEHLRQLTEYVEQQIVSPLTLEIAEDGDWYVKTDILPTITSAFPLHQNESEIAHNQDINPLQTITSQEEIQEWADNSGIDLYVEVDEVLQNIPEAHEILQTNFHNPQIRQAREMGLSYKNAVLLVSVALCTPEVAEKLRDIKLKNLNQYTMNRRQFLLRGGATLAAGLVVLAGCTPPSGERQPQPEELEDSPTFTEGSPITDFEAELREILGPEWKEEITENGLDTVIDTDPDRSPLAAFLVGAVVANEATVQNGFLDKMRVKKVLANGDPRLAEIIDTGVDTIAGMSDTEAKYIFYHENTRGGFVVFDRKTNTWYKFFRQPGGLEGEYMSYLEQSVAMWRENGRMWQMFTDTEIEHIAMGVTQIDDVTYTWHRTPHVGKQTYEKLLRAGENPELVKQEILNWYRQAVSHLRDGNFAAAQVDPNPGNIARNGSIHRQLSLDFDNRPYAFDKPETAARYLGKKMASIYRGNEHRVYGSMGFSITEAELDTILQEVFQNPELRVNAKDLRSIKLQIPGWQKDAKTQLGVHWIHDVQTQRGVHPKRLKLQTIERLKQEGGIPESMRVGVTTSNGDLIKEVDIFFNTKNTTFEALKLSSVQKRWLRIFNTLKPGLRVAGYALDILILYELMREAYQRGIEPNLNVESSSDQAATTGAFATYANINQLIGTIESATYAKASEIVSQKDGNVGGYEHLSEAVRALEKATGVPLTFRSLTEFGVVSDPEDDPFIGPNIQVRNVINEVLLSSDIWHKARVTGFSPIPLMPYGEVESNIYIRLQRNGDSTDILTFGSYDNGLQDVVPVFELVTQNGNIIDIEWYDSEQTLVIEGYGDQKTEYDQFALSHPETKQQLINYINQGQFRAIWRGRKEPQEGA